MCCYLCGYATRIYFVTLIFLLQAIPHTIIIFVMYRALNCVYVPRDNLLLMFGYAAYFYHSKCVNLTTARFPPGYISPNDDTYFIFYKDWPTSTPKGKPLRYTFAIGTPNYVGGGDRLDELKNYFRAKTSSSITATKNIGTTEERKKVDTTIFNITNTESSSKVTTSESSSKIETSTVLTTSALKVEIKTFEESINITNISMVEKKQPETEKTTNLLKEASTLPKIKSILGLTMVTEDVLSIDDKVVSEDKSDVEVILNDKRIKKSIAANDINDFSLQKSKIKSKAMLEKYQLKKVQFMERNVSSSEEVDKLKKHDFRYNKKVSVENKEIASHLVNVSTTQSMGKIFKPSIKQLHFIARPIAPYLGTSINENKMDELLKVLFHGTSQLNPDFWNKEKLQWIMSLLNPTTWIVYFLKMIWGEMDPDNFGKLLTQAPFFEWPELSFVNNNFTNLTRKRLGLMHGWEEFPGRKDTTTPNDSIHTGPTFPGLPGIPTEYPTGWENITRSTISSQRAANLIYMSWPTKSASYDTVKTIVYSYLVLDLLWLVSILFLIVAALVRIRGPGTLFFYIPFIATTLAILILDIIAGIYFTLTIPNTWEFLDYLAFTGISNMDDVRNPIKIWFPNYGYTYAIPSWALSVFFVRGIVIWFFNWVLLCKISHIFLRVTRQSCRRNRFAPIIRKTRSWTYSPHKRRSSLMPIKCFPEPSTSCVRLQDSSQMSGHSRSSCSKGSRVTECRCSDPCVNNAVLKIYCKADPCKTSSEETYIC